MKITILLATLLSFSCSTWAGNILRAQAPISKASAVIENPEDGSEPSPPEAEPEPETTMFRIIGAVAGQNGIYTVEAPAGERFQAYVDMATNGGNWILALYWTNPLTPASKMRDLAVPGNPLVTWTADSGSYPVIPSGVSNAASEGMIVSTNPNWTSRYGAWQSFPTEDGSRTVNEQSPLVVQTPQGAINLWLSSNGWARSATFDNSNFGLWTSSYNTGLCGGDGRGGSLKICPAYAGAGSGNHVDMTYDKFYFLKGKAW